MKIKVSEASGAALDWAVTYALHGDCASYIFKHGRSFHAYSTDWSQGGPILEREGGTVWSTNADGWRCKAKYDYANDREGVTMTGHTPLIAAMRCYVSSKLGEEVEIPEELI